MLHSDKLDFNLQQALHAFEESGAPHDVLDTGIDYIPPDVYKRAHAETCRFYSGEVKWSL